MSVSLNTSGPRAARAVLSWRPVVWVGVTSCTVHLLHNPLITISNDAHLPRCFIAVAVATAFVLATASHRWMEGPVRARARSTDIRQRDRPRRTVGARERSYGAVAPGRGASGGDLA